MQEFSLSNLKQLFKPGQNSFKEDNGQVTIIGGSSLFHGAPLLALKTASRVVDMIFFSSPESSVGKVAEKIKSQLGAFIWVPFEEIDGYLAKSDAVLIGPGFLRYRKEVKSSKLKVKSFDREREKTKKITDDLLEKYPNKQWVIDAGSLQTMDVNCIPKGAILTPNRKEFVKLFGEFGGIGDVGGKVREMAEKYDCIIVYKTPETIVCSPDECVLVKGGNAGLTKGGTGDVLAGLTVALAAKNDPFFAACAASFIAKKAADELYNKVGFAYNADDLAEKIPEVLGEYFR